MVLLVVDTQKAITTNLCGIEDMPNVFLLKKYLN